MGTSEGVLGRVTSRERKGNQQPTRGNQPLLPITPVCHIRSGSTGVQIPISLGPCCIASPLSRTRFRNPTQNLPILVNHHVCDATSCLSLSFSYGPSRKRLAQKSLPDWETPIIRTSRAPGDWVKPRDPERDCRGVSMQWYGKRLEQGKTASLRSTALDWALKLDEMRDADGIYLYTRWHLFPIGESFTALSSAQPAILSIYRPNINTTSCCVVLDNGPPSAFSTFNSSSFLSLSDNEQYLALSACALLAFTACHLAACVTYRKANKPWLYVALASGATSRMYKGTAA
ncbi:hypothetical protein QR685DRAFT_137121 [Neurospora intermedia]|uniref:Uncharacterized protein n=1 Tax=Neurospora intermedia TaxID=5142 RepID=A0ABR3CY02_NEUIN